MSRTDRQRLRSEAGITIVEVIVAATVLLIGLLAGFLALDSASSAGKTAERQAIAAAVAERQIERLLAMSWSELAHCKTPEPSADPDSPLHQVQTGAPARFKVLQDYRTPSLGTLAETPAEGEELVLQDPQTAPCDADRTDAVFEGPIPFSSGTAAGAYYRFVTWRDDTCVAGFPDALETLLDGITGLVTGLLEEIQGRVNTGVNAFCLQPRDSKRLTVAVVLGAAADYGPHKPTWVSTIQTNAQDGLIIDSDGRFDFPQS